MSISEKNIFQFRKLNNVKFSKSHYDEYLEKNPNGTSIFCFSWNTQSTKLCESLNEEIVDQNRSGYFTSYTQSSCEIVDFLTDLNKYINEYDPTILVYSLQEDASPGSYFHSDLLREELPKIGYTLYERNKLIGVGVTTFTKRTLRGLRVSMYVKSDLVDYFAIPELIKSKKLYNPNWTQGKGAVSLNILLPGGEILTVINTHLPFNAKSLFESKKYQDPMIRQDALLKSNIFFNKLVQILVYFRDDEYFTKSDHVLIMGDLNYRVEPYIEYSAELTTQNILDNIQDPELHKDVLIHDELYQQREKGNIYYFLEGVDDQGPMFPPTCKMKIEKEELDRESRQSVGDTGVIGTDSYLFGKEDQRVGSFCDRIVYSENISCFEYDRFEYGMMNESDHAGIIGLYEIIS